MKSWEESRVPLVGVATELGSEWCEAARESEPESMEKTFSENVIERTLIPLFFHRGGKLKFLSSFISCVRVGTDGAVIENGVNSEVSNNYSNNENVLYYSEETESDAHGLDFVSDVNGKLIEARKKLLNKKGKMKLNEGDQNEVIGKISVQNACGSQAGDGLSSKPPSGIQNRNVKMKQNVPKCYGVIKCGFAIEVWKSCANFVSINPDGIVSVIKWADSVVSDSDSVNFARLFLSKIVQRSKVE
ncbi:hypothetical protein LguiA_010574 [Lonicera macranthoides]